MNVSAAVVLLVAIVFAQAAARDLARYKPRGVLFPRPPSRNKKPIFPVKHTATINTRSFCGRENSTNSRIVGGTVAEPHSLPWQVALFVDDRFFCGGSLISNEWILTAAHCAEDAGFFDILLGSHNVRLNATEEPSRFEIRSNVSIVHPGWSSFRFMNDIALVKIPQPIKFTPEIQPVCLAPPSEPDHVDDILHVSGWGRHSELTPGISQVLREIDVPCISNEECALTYGETITDGIICISTAGGRGSCNGDSGGPLTFVNDGIHNQVGVVSFGSSQGCDKNLPAGFSRVSFYAEWISSITGLII
ncbi:brachyurin-like [Daphnia pulex]|uniref:brachyurin-like n=1 Tax=Daphnia pulex TaxID=6669 RepID=UPI001EDF2265|nr:brachyurin-like [Daphnia pulex]